MKLNKKVVSALKLAAVEKGKEKPVVKALKASLQQKPVVQTKPAPAPQKKDNTIKGQLTPIMAKARIIDDAKYRAAILADPKANPELKAVAQRVQQQLNAARPKTQAQPVNIASKSEVKPVAAPVKTAAPVPAKPILTEKAFGKPVVAPVKAVVKPEISMFRVLCGKCGHHDTIEALHMPEGQKDARGIILSKQDTQKRLDEQNKPRFCAFCFGQAFNGETNKLYPFYVAS